MSAIDKSNPLKNQARKIWQSGIAAVDAGALLDKFVQITDRQIIVGDRIFLRQDYQNLVVVGAGKCCAAMAVALERKLIQQLPSEKTFVGRVNVPDDHVLPSQRIELIGCRPAGINLPTTRVLESTQEMTRILREADPADLVICLLTGGGSALLELPQPPVTLPDLIDLTQHLSHAGATIEQLNTVRRAISKVKGGGLVRHSNCRHWITLIVSDIWGDPLDLIASGPTLVKTDIDVEADSKIRAERAIEVLDEFYLDRNQIPQTVWQFLQTLIDSQRPAEVKWGRTEADPLPQLDETKLVEHFVLGNNQTAVEAAERAAIELGFRCEHQYEWEIDGPDAPVEKVASRLAAQLWEQLLEMESQDQGATDHQKINSNHRQPWCLITGGEPTVQIGTNSESVGHGGRNQHLILWTIKELIQRVQVLGRIPTAEFCILSGGSDGEDGNTAVAGAYFDSSTLRRLVPEEPLDEIDHHLAQADSHRILSRWDLIFEAPRTDTNVCDLRVLLISR